MSELSFLCAIGIGVLLGVFFTYSYLVLWVFDTWND